MASRNEMKRAWDIYETLPDNRKYCILYDLITEARLEHQIAKAIEIFQKFPIPSNKNSEGYKKLSLDSLLSYAHNFKRFDIYESLLPIVEKEEKLLVLIPFLIDLINHQQVEKAAVLILTYSDDLNQVNPKHIWHTHRLIEIFVKMRCLESAWQLTLKIKDSDDLALYTLRDELEEAKINEEEHIFKQTLDMINELKGQKTNNLAETNSGKSDSEE